LYRYIVARGAAPAGEKAIVFSQWTAMLDLLEPCLKAGLRTSRITVDPQRLKAPGF
jgi:SNF2 family DNA or RNA helicase